MRIVKRALDKKENVCAICSKAIDIRSGHNPAPLEIEGQVCDSCNIEYVIPARLKELDLLDEDEIKAQDSELLRHPEYAVEYQIGDRVRFKHPGQVYSDEIAEIIGFDEDGLYQIKWLDDGTLSHGLGDVNLVPEDAAEGDDDPFYQQPQRAFDNKAQDQKPEKLKIVIKRIR